MGISTNEYDPRFFASIATSSLDSASIIVPLVLRDLAPSSVVDFGCGEGAWLSTFVANGLQDVQGFDGDYVDRTRLRIDARRFTAMDLEYARPAGRRFDLAISLEVAEHLTAAGGRRLVEALCQSSEIILFSAAVPGQGGTRHINEQWLEYWIDQFAVQGHRLFDVYRPRIAFDRRVGWWYRQNLVLFVSKSAVGRLPTAWSPRGTRRWAGVGAHRDSTRPTPPPRVAPRTSQEPRRCDSSTIAPRYGTGQSKATTLSSCRTGHARQMRAALISLLVLLPGCTSSKMPGPGISLTPTTTRVLSGVTVDSGRVRAVANGLSVGTSEGIGVDGRTVVAALTDAHGHLVGLGLSLVRVDLRNCPSPKECAERVRKALGSAPPGSWIQGRGWDQNLFPDKQFPTRAALDAVAPSTPVYVRRVDGHAAWVNSEALRRAKITRTTPDPAGRSDRPRRLGRTHRRPRRPRDGPRRAGHPRPLRRGDRAGHPPRPGPPRLAGAHLHPRDGHRRHDGRRLPAARDGRAASRSASTPTGPATPACSRRPSAGALSRPDRTTSSPSARSSSTPTARSAPAEPTSRHPTPTIRRAPDWS